MKPVEEDNAEENLKSIKAKNESEEKPEPVTSKRKKREVTCPHKDRKHYAKVSVSFPLFIESMQQLLS